VSAETTPMLRIVKGNPDDAETAALTAVLLALAAPSRDEPAAAVSAWARTARQPRSKVHSGPGGWRASGLAA
jgi:hypothetical protein